MQKNGTYGDHITLQRVCDIFYVQIIVYSSLGQMATQVITPGELPSETNIPTLFLYHIAEGHGDHYVSLVRPQRTLQDILREINCAEDTTDTHENQTARDRSPDIGVNLEQESSHADEIPSTVVPPELLKIIIEKTLAMDMSMNGTFNRVSHLFKQLVTRYYPRLHISSHIGQLLGIIKGEDVHISVRKLYATAGRGSSIADRIGEILDGLSNWLNAWFVLSASAYSWYMIKDIYWK